MTDYGNILINGPIVITPNTTYITPLILMPPTSGSGAVNCRTELMFDADTTTNGVAARFIMQIGVTNPSQFLIPMWPWLGLDHVADPGVTIVMPGNIVSRQTISRLDVVDQTNQTVGYQPVPRDWVMAKAAGNNNFPQLEATITNQGTANLTLWNLQFRSLAYN